MSSKHDAAVTLSVRGWRVFPCSENSKIPMKGMTDWNDRATDDIDEITRIWTENPNANIGLATGPSGLLVLDFDSAKSPQESSGIENFRAAFPGRKLPPTYTVRTASGGWHLYYRTPPVPLRNSAGRLAERVDTRGEGGYVIAPGSTVDGGVYAATNPVSACAELPEWIVELLSDKPATRQQHTPRGNSTAYAMAALRSECDALAGTTEGGRNHAANRSAWNVSRFVARGELDELDAFSALMTAAIECGLPEREAKNAINSGLNRGAKYYEQPKQ